MFYFWSSLLALTPTILFTLWWALKEDYSHAMRLNVRMMMLQRQFYQNRIN